MDHLIHGLVVKSNTRGDWDFEVAASLYDYARDIVARRRCRTAGNARRRPDHRPARHRLEHARREGDWRPAGPAARTSSSSARSATPSGCADLVSDTPDWSGGAPAARFSAFAGRTSLTSLWAQDAWRFAPDWRAVLGVRGERWHAEDGALSNPTTTLRLRAAQRVVRVAEGGAVLAGDGSLAGAEGLARPRRSHADRQRAVPGLDLGQRNRQQRPQPEAGEVVDLRADGRARPSPAAARARPSSSSETHGRALFADQRRRRAARSRRSRTSTASAPRASRSRCNRERSGSSRGSS